MIKSVGEINSLVQPPTQEYHPLGYFGDVMKFQNNRDSSCNFIKITEAHPNIKAHFLTAWGFLL